MPLESAERADLHMHSVHSDGEHAPAELVAMAKRAGLRAISLTDHDTIAGWQELAERASASDLEVVTGVELSGRHGKRDAHILGYGIDLGNARLREALERFRDRRNHRAVEMVRKLNAIGVPLSVADVDEAAGGAVVGRPHVADALARAGLVTSYDEAFRRYIGVGRPGYVPKSAFTADEAVTLIHEAGGVAVLAHPGRHFGENDLESLAAKGLDGVEVRHPRHGPEEMERFTEAAGRLGLLTTGGSDFHGASRGEAVVGSPSIPYEWVIRLKERS